MGRMRKITYKELRALFGRAESEKFAVPAFNYSDMWDMRAIVEAAEALHAPVILMADPPTYRELGMDMCCCLAETFIERATVPVIHHLDHSESPEDCISAIDSGFTSVMMDASASPLEQNISVVKRVVEYAHLKGVFVEAEIGRIKSTDEKNSDESFRHEDAARLADETGCDLLAIGIGNAHGFYKGEPRIDHDKLRDVDNALDIPLVLHGGTGIPRATVEKCIDGGIRKVNVGTAVYCAYMNGARKKLMAGENQFTYDVMHEAMDEVKKTISEWIRICRADGKA